MFGDLTGDVQPWEDNSNLETEDVASPCGSFWRFVCNHFGNQYAAPVARDLPFLASTRTL